VLLLNKASQIRRPRYGVPDETSQIRRVVF
jgi:hypothetical protein